MSSDKEKKYKAHFIFEVMGHPKEHLITALENLIKSISEEKEIKVTNSKINEVKELEKKKGFYTTFAEVEVEVQDMFLIIYMTFKYMPAFIELVYPENIALDNSGVNELLNEVTRRLHAYEELARIFQVEKANLEGKIKELTEGKESEKPIKKSKTKETKKKK